MAEGNLLKGNTATSTALTSTEGLLGSYMTEKPTYQALAHHRRSGCGTTQPTRRNFAL